MMRYRLELKILIGILIIISAEDVSAQQAEKDTVKTDTIKNKYVPTGVRIGTDVISLVKSRAQDDFSGWEISGEIDFSRYYLTADYGTWGRNFNSDSAAYSNDGKFWRVGVDVNFLKNDPDRNVFFIGGRYGRSVFSENMTLTSYDPTWGTLETNYSHSGVHAWWLELTAGLRVKIWKIFWLGYTGRFKFALTTDETPEMLPHDVPGFGRTHKDTTWGFNYYVMIRIPVRKASLASVKKK
jgi:hypothetical protein